MQVSTLPQCDRRILRTRTVVVQSAIVKAANEGRLVPEDGGCMNYLLQGRAASWIFSPALFLFGRNAVPRCRLLLVGLPICRSLYHGAPLLLMLTCSSGRRSKHVVSPRQRCGPFLDEESGVG